MDLALAVATNFRRAARRRLRAPEDVVAMALGFTISRNMPTGRALFVISATPHWEWDWGSSFEADSSEDLSALFCVLAAGSSAEQTP